MKYRLICSLLVVLLCVGGYLALDRTSATAPASSDEAATQSAAPAAPSSPDDNAMKDLKVN